MDVGDVLNGFVSGLMVEATVAIAARLWPRVLTWVRGHGRRHRDHTPKHFR